ncbi:unnamed protein product, partial [Staurois parvus]
YGCQTHSPFQTAPFPPPPPSANPSTGLHSVSSTPLCQSLHSVSSTPLCQSLHWPPFSVLHPPLPIPPLASIQCPPPPSANPSTGLHSCPPPPSANPSTDLHSVTSTPLCQSLHWPPLSVLHSPLPIPPLASDCATDQIQNPNTDVQSRPPYCPELHH